ncbi:aspartate/glutamate racemase family protein [Streptomyces profundus]|uniref:aspartate/glutamate racemase family protein n=1 Tax=Streptomyces profundus TaxID=2867410 RepID=UPI001D1641F9|nr:aspartate/glutamate racemase family protein [Streptomyces sp. MA3_2.13]UED83860.1 aspartate/glutamate racemase family protein [Streptomyces sp. MA3_2.13]
MIGFLHTAAVHQASFQGLLDELAPGTPAEHLISERHLERAREHGLDEVTRAEVRRDLDQLAENGAEVIVCTCSSIAGLAEEYGAQAGGPLPVPVLRVDRPMAEAAVRAGRRIAIIATSASSIDPTSQLLDACARAAGREVELVPAPCLSAWELFTAGDTDGYAREVATHARRLATDVDVLVLAQASMAPAKDLLTDLPTPVLSTPRLGVEGALRHRAA